MTAWSHFETNRWEQLDRFTSAPDIAAPRATLPFRHYRLTAGREFNEPVGDVNTVPCFFFMQSHKKLSDASFWSWRPRCFLGHCDYKYSIDNILRYASAGLRAACRSWHANLASQKNLAECFKKYSTATNGSIHTDHNGMGLVIANDTTA